MVKRCGYGNGRRGFNDNFHTLPNEAHSIDNFLLCNGNNIVYVAPDAAEGQLAQRGSQTVGYRICTLYRMALAGCKGQVSIIGHLRFRAYYFYITGYARSGNSGSAEQSASTHRSQNYIQLGLIFQQFQGRRSLSRNNIRIIIGMNEGCAAIIYDLMERLFACLLRG